MNNPFSSVDSLKITFNHIKVWYTSGMGFFTDAYDLFVISAILTSLTSAYKYANIIIPGFTEYLIGNQGSIWIGLLASSAIWTAVIGQLVFGYLSDKLGRKKVYGVEASILAIAAVLSSLSPNLLYLIAFRSVMGIGIGGDYPVSATIMSEYSNVNDRGKLIALVFANQALGSITAIVVGIVTSLILPPSIAWRVMAGLGALPATAVIYMRRKVPETPRYSLLVQGNKEEAKRAAKFLGSDLELDKGVISKRRKLKDFLRDYSKTLMGTAITWFLLDIAFYGTGIYQSASITPVFGSPFEGNQLTLTQFQADLARALFLGGIPFIVGLPGYFIAVALMDRMGRKWIQVQGFAAMAILYFIVSSVIVTSGVTVSGFLIPSTIAFAIYSLSYFFIQFGPNTTTFVIPAEVFPVRYRSTGHGISAASGKLGAALTTYVFPFLLSSIGIREIFILLAVISIIGAVITYILVPEPKRKSLEEASKEEVMEVNA